MKSILFRADSSSTIGTGHIMRDLVLSQQFENDNIIFATQDLPGNINYKIEEKNHEIVILNSNDIEELKALVQTFKIDVIVIDHYDIGYDFERQLKEANKALSVFVLDDTYERHYCDVLLNHNLYANNAKYKNLVPKWCELRCGSKYTLLREEFIVERERGRQNKNDDHKVNVFIAMGGADHSNINIKILEVLKQFLSLHAHVVTTRANQHLKELEKYAAISKKLTLHVNTSQIATLMNQADFAIITPSVTINEIFFLKVPFIAIQTADNQCFMYDYLIEKKYNVSAMFDSIVLAESVEKMIKELK